MIKVGVMELGNCLLFWTCEFQDACSISQWGYESRDEGTLAKRSELKV